MQKINIGFNNQQSVVPKERIQNIQAVENFFDVIQCAVCYNVVVQPVFCMECEKNICLTCYNQWQNQQVQCPSCKQESLNKHMENKLLIKLLSKLKLYCINQVVLLQCQGCHEILDYNTRAQHEMVCRYTSMECPNLGCYEIILQKDLNDHLFECPCTQIQCSLCDSLIQQKLLNQHNLNICPCRQSKCEMCEQYFEFRNLATHQQNCPCKPQQCPECQHSFPANSDHSKVDCLEAQLNDCITKCNDEEDKGRYLETKLDEHDNCIAALEYQLENITLQIQGFAGYADHNRNLTQ